MNLTAKNQSNRTRKAIFKSLWIISSLVVTGLMVLATGLQGKRNPTQNTSQINLQSRQGTGAGFANNLRCSTPPVSSRRTSRMKPQPGTFKMALQRKTVRVFFHVITKGPSPVTDGNISRKMIDEQMRVLNEKFAKTNFQFELCVDCVDWKENSEWYRMEHPSKAESEAMQTLGRRQMDVLNVYTAGLTGTHGWGIYPWDSKRNPYHDGVVICFETLPGNPGFEGKTLVHEAAHWLGLLHTFEKGCAEPGDGVADTPAELIPAPSNVCLFERRNTCPEIPGDDPVENFMDTAPDSCMTKFTGDQSARMDMWFETCRRQMKPCSAY